MKCTNLNYTIQQIFTNGLYLITQTFTHVSKEVQGLTIPSQPLSSPLKVTTALILCPNKYILLALELHKICINTVLYNPLVSMRFIHVFVNISIGSFLLLGSVTLYEYTTQSIYSLTGTWAVSVSRHYKYSYYTHMLSTSHKHTFFGQLIFSFLLGKY